jgi:hypothetical protein
MQGRQAAEMAEIMKTAAKKVTNAMAQATSHKEAERQCLISKAKFEKTMAD